MKHSPFNILELNVGDRVELVFLEINLLQNKEGGTTVETAEQGSHRADTRTNTDTQYIVCF